ncbi:MAG: hypothetical protein Q9175_005686 [Cornicularia normoerica]
MTFYPILDSKLQRLVTDSLRGSVSCFPSFIANFYLAFLVSQTTFLPHVLGGPEALLHWDSTSIRPSAPSRPLLPPNDPNANNASVRIGPQTSDNDDRTTNSNANANAGDRAGAPKQEEDAIDAATATSARTPGHPPLSNASKRPLHLPVTDASKCDEWQQRPRSRTAEIAASIQTPAERGTPVVWIWAARFTALLVDFWEDEGATAGWLGWAGWDGESEGEGGRLWKGPFL